MDVVVLLIHSHRRSKGEHWFISCFPHGFRVCFMPVCTPSVFGLPEKDVFGGSYKGVKHKILSLVFMFSQISQMQ